MKDLIKFEEGKIYIAVQTEETSLGVSTTVYIHKIISRTEKTAKVASGTLNGKNLNWFNEPAKTKKIIVFNNIEILAGYRTPVCANLYRC